MEITPNSTTTRQSNTSTTRTEPEKNQQLSQGATSTQAELQLSSTSQALTQAFQQAVDWLQQEAIEPFQGRRNQLATASVNIDVGRYNLYLVDQKVNELQQTFGSSVDVKEMKNQLTQASGITTNNPLSSANRKDELHQNVAGLLHEKDVQALTDIYIHAKEEGLDTDQVNHLAFYMGHYRGTQQHSNYSYHPPEKPVDSETVEQAQAIYSSNENPVTELDSGFLESMLNPDKMLKSFSKVVDLGFLESVTGAGKGGDVFPPSNYPGTPEQATTSDSQATTSLSKEDLKEQLTAWLDQHWAQQSSLTSQLLGLDLADQQDTWAQLRGLFA
ncbi:hypothetical protein [Marinospirillum sp.]|uniref:hypothetical protein n=1 Tax=Marinospirillum sp. TaxID=2183934 RepID=UPI00384C13DA